MPQRDPAACGNQYERQGGRQRGDRIVCCDLLIGHPGDHEEIDTGNTWPAAHDPAADAHTIATRLLAEMSTLRSPDMAALLGTSLGAVPLDHRDAIRAELTRLADQLTLALHPSTAITWGWTRPGGRPINLAPAEPGYRTRSAAARSARMDGIAEPTILHRLVQDWQPAPTTESKED